MLECCAKITYINNLYIFHHIVKALSIILHKKIGHDMKYGFKKERKNRWCLHKKESTMKNHEEI